MHAFCYLRQRTTDLKDQQNAYSRTLSTENCTPKCLNRER